VIRFAASTCAGRLRQDGVNPRRLVAVAHGAVRNDRHGSAAFGACLNTVYSTSRDGGVVIPNREKRKRHVRLQPSFSRF